MNHDAYVRRLTTAPPVRRLGRAGAMATIAVIIAVSVAGCSRQDALPSPAASASGPLALPSTNTIDLSHPFNAETIYWPTEAGFARDVTAQGPTERGYYYEAATFTSAEHGGTHIDAPVHFWEGARSVDEIPLDQLMGGAVVIDVSDHTKANPDYRITAEDITSWESNNRPIPDGSILLFRTDFSRFWPDRARYLGTAEIGPAAVANLHFPGLHPDAARWLIRNRSVKAIGIDTPSIDYGQSQQFQTHQIFFEQNIPVIENLTNLGQVAPGSIIVALPMKIEAGSGAPVRVIAFVP